MAQKIVMIEDLIREDSDTTIAEYWALLKDVEGIELTMPKDQVKFRA